ncbi:DUF2059 domain-containing protein [Chryseobacterium carnipullorum]|uniref:DUF2059 domain-containing protein n=1 Tax=Chryseobacterium carnipullorum TaxID=1124835 RepID=UPI00090F3366|nr:DUF2059 domain-containing protein [Chryseobacterium carnipullorum]MDN5475588.1 DUF2059 domain-containing protein [Chryseobacterium sp.]MDN5479944.1 DUF2059 domain-containing protein [Chryseobacterium sp.]SHL89853.1 hypothetical protein SAMN05444360_105230 [Chryseobacterium carnipullorum]HBV17895.1 DUF2059 domain-containing protein [Chryseobacterium carnipullorum]
MKKLITTVSLLVGTLLFSQTSEAKVRELIKVMGADKMAISGMQQQMQEIKKNSPNISDEFFNEFVAEVTTDRITEVYIPIYAKYYTESEIDELIKFYKSPVGKKTISVLPDIMKESIDAGGKMGRDIAIKVKEKLDKKAGYQNPPPPMPEKSK